MNMMRETDMSVPTSPPTEERIEAVIISGPRRGEIIELPAEAWNFTPEQEALLDEMIASANRMAETAQRMARETEEFSREFRGRWSG
jgi:hypothetical protein